jgi:acetylornithine deacetylase/succinyl-diaminopimelate desuccinylase-like protein
MNANSVLKTARTVTALTLIAATTRAEAQAADAAALRGKIKAYSSAHDAEIIRELSNFLAIPNLASDQANIRRNAAHLMRMMEARGISTRLLESPAGGPPAVFGELRVPGAAKTVVLYAHYDGQPVDTAKWTNPPWQPTLRDKALDAGGAVIPLPSNAGLVQGEWRLYARSASDDKAPIIAMLTALDALKSAGAAPSVNLKLFFEGEEEAGSGHLRELLVEHAALLKADAWLFGDGPVHQSRRQQIVFGARGVTGMNLTIYGPSRGLHSGHYGNWAPNPIALLANFIASLRNDDGRILIKNFYDDVAPITATDRKAIAAMPSIDSALRAELSLGATEAKNAPLMERIMLPALNLRGIQSGGVNELSSNVIPSDATASIDFRLVPRQTPERVRRLMEAHARAQGYFVVDHTPTLAERAAHARVMKMTWGEGGYPATRVSMDAPLSKAVVQATREALGAPIVTLPILGGSLPLATFESVLNTPLIVLPIVNHDNSQHSHNENLRMQNLFDGIQVYAGIFGKLGTYWRTVM